LHLPEIGLLFVPLAGVGIPSDVPNPLYRSSAFVMNDSDSGVASFGPFRLSPASREIERDGVPLALGDRALDILIALVERAGEIVSQKDLLARVWRDLVVSPGNLRVHMTALRKALGCGQGGVRYIENVIGQGYCFVAPVTRNADAKRPASQRSPSLTVAQLRALPPPLARMVGRDDTVRTIAADLRMDRFVTIVGPGGMGKTTVAVSVAHAMLEEFSGNVCFVDIGAITDPKLLTATVASTLGLSIQGEHITATLMAFLRTTRMLLVLDNCEHVIDAAASLAETICSEARAVHILATSREALRVEGEHAHWLRPLASPPQDAGVSAATALTFPAIKLFVERAMASDSRFELTDANAPIVADICGRLDGIALALELVAGRIGTYGLEGAADLLNKRFGLHWQGRRTALPRHQTLNALLDWSYSLLPQSEQRVLRMLSIFVGPFTVEAAQAMACDAEPDDVRLANAIDSLIAKSLMSVIKTHEGATSYRLLETTRIYAMRKLEESGEADATAERHAQYFILLLNSTSGGRLEPCLEPRTPARPDYLGNLRAALEWCFGHRAASQRPRNVALGIDLAAASAPAFLDFSLWNECLNWSAAAVALLQDPTRGDKRELVLQEACAICSTWTRGNNDDVSVAILRGLEIANRLGETAHRLRLLTGLQTYLIRTTDFNGSLVVAEEMDAVARATNDVSCLVMSDWLRASSQHFLGDQAAAKQLYENGFARGGARNAQQFGLDYRVRALVGLARVLWLSGYPERALPTAREAIAEATHSAKPLNVCFSFIYTCHVFLWCGDLSTAQDVVGKLIAHPLWQGLLGFHPEGLALKGELLVRRGNVAEGIELLRAALSDMKVKNQKNLMLTITASFLAGGLSKAGHLDEALAVITDTLAHPPGNAQTWETPELLRVRASILLSMPQPDEVEAERCLMHSLALARHQSAKGWELRTTTTLAQLRARQGRDTEARDLLSNVYAQFTEGFETQDLKAAAKMLGELDRTHDSNTSVDVEDRVFDGTLPATYLDHVVGSDSAARRIE
jgi:predicted ATPase/DNA-binding winged helix-turn-helix (wHTH) protein